MEGRERREIFINQSQPTTLKKKKKTKTRKLPASGRSINLTSTELDVIYVITLLV